MELEKAQQLLRKTLHKITPIPDEIWKAFIHEFEYVTYPKGAYLTKEGQIEHYMYFVLEGVQRGFHIYNGQEVCIAFSFHPSFSGIPESFITQKPAKCYLQALSDSAFLRISYPKLQALYDKYKIVERFGRIVAEQVLVGFLERQLEMVSFSAEERYLRLYNQSPHVFQLIPQKHLASYIGMTPETFSRMRKKIK